MLWYICSKQRNFPLWGKITIVVSKFCSQHDLTKIPIKSDTEQKAYDTYAANDLKGERSERFL